MDAVPDGYDTFHVTAYRLAGCTHYTVTHFLLTHALYCHTHSRVTKTKMR